MAKKKYLDEVGLAQVVNTIEGQINDLHEEIDNLIVGEVTCDEVLDISSNRPVANKVIANEFNKIANGTVIVGKAEQDADGNIISDTYVTNQENEINISNLESAINSKVDKTLTINNKDLSENINLTAADVGADSAGAAEEALTSAKSYSDSNAASTLASAKEYNDAAYANANLYTDQKIADLINGAPTTLDTLKEIADAMAEHEEVVEALDEAIGSKANQAELDTHTGNDTIHITADERTAWDKNTTDISNIISGTTAVGDASKLGGETSDEWQTKLDNIQTTSRATLSTAGWYRVAECVGGHNGSLFLRIGNLYAEVGCEEHTLFFDNSSAHVGFIPFSCKSTSETSRIFSKVRYTRDSAKRYLEVYYVPSKSNPCGFSIFGQESTASGIFKAVTPTLTAETADGVTVTTTYDIPANASPVTNLDLAQVDGSVTLTTPLLEKALSITEDGVYIFKLNRNSTGLPHEYYAIGSATVIVRNGTTTHEGTEVILWGSNGVASRRIATNYYTSSGTWTGWAEFATTADLANYFKNTGGIINGDLQIVINNPYNTTFRQKNTVRSILERVYSDGTYRLHDETNNKTLIESAADGTTTANLTASGNVAKTGDTMSGDLEVKRTTTDTARIKATSSDGVSIGLAANTGTSGVYDYGNGKWVLENCQTDTPKLNGIATKNLALDGGIGFQTVKSKTSSPVIIDNTSDGGTLSVISYDTNGTRRGSIGFSGSDNPVFVGSDKGTIRKFLHEGNVGSYALPLTGGTYLEKGVDLNDYKTPGVYIAGDSETAATIVNTPHSGSGYKVFVIDGYIAGRVTQFVTTNSNSTYHRQFNGTSWSEWATPYNTTNKPKLTDLGVTATASELNKLDGVTATTTELNYVDGVTSSIQTQLNAKVPTSRTVNGKALSSNITLSASDVGADTSGSANTALTNAKSYTDTKISNLINGAPTTLDTLKEIADAMAENQDVVEALETAIGNKVDKVSGKGLSTNDYTTTEKNKLSGIASGAEVNQNAFSNVTVGSTTIAADSKTDTLTLVAGSNVTITPDATNDKITIAATDTKALGSMTGTLAISQGGTGATDAATARTNLGITPANIGALSTSGTAANASRLSNTSAIGSATQPVYFNANGVPVKCTYTLNKTVPSDAVFTDTKVSISANAPTSATNYYPVMHTATSGTTAVTANTDVKFQNFTGTTSSAGYNVLLLGNTTASGTAKNAYGMIRLYGTGAYYTQVKAGNPTANRTITLPNESGTLFTTNGGTITGNVTMSGKRLIQVAGVYTSTVANRFQNSALEIRENGLVANAQTDIGYAPTIGFHWGNVGAATLAMDSAAQFNFFKQDGSLANIICGAVYMAGNTNYTVNQARNGVFTTTDPGAGASTSYANGSVIYVYE